MIDKQSDFFSFVQSPGPALADFAELCNALYERELLKLAYFGPKDPSLMQRRLAGLSYHVKRIAYFLCHKKTTKDWPLSVDTHNATWQSKQAAKLPGKQVEFEKTLAWYQQHAAPGLVVPVYVENMDSETIELDTVDRIDYGAQKVHLNKFGWFSLTASNDKQQSGVKASLLKPSKAIMQAACCGHSWNYKSRISPRSLSLREMMLSTQIDWKRFKLMPITLEK